MNVVGRFSSLISQGVYSVATPFHPFGGAVDIIVVEQEDGSYRSTPWYVRFGKFQGVLKGAEKIVRISVNGTEADFHMYLDNSGEAYFVREVESGGVDGDSSHRIHDFSASSLDQSESNDDGNANGDVESPHENGVEKQEHTENGNKTYGLQDEDQSLETPSDSPHFSPDSQEFPSYHYGSLDEVEDVVESSKNSNAEMVLISVDGHVLTAPITSSEEVTQNLELNTPQFHLGPGESSSEDFGSERGGWSANLFEDMEPPSSDVRETTYETTLGDNGNDEKESQIMEQMDLTNKPDDYSRGLYRKDTFMSCCEFPEINDDIDDSDFQPQHLERISDSEGQCGISLEVPSHHTSENHHQEEEAGNHSVDGASVVLSTSETVGSKVEIHEEGLLVRTDIEHVDAERASVSAVSDAIELNTSHKCMTSSTDDVLAAAKCGMGYEDKRSVEVENLTNVDSASLTFESPKSIVEQEDEMAGGAGQFSRYAGQESNKVESSETQGSTNPVHMGFELSLCAKLLHSGMGSSSASEVFETHRISKKDFELSSASIITNENLIVRFKGKYFNWVKISPVVLGMAVYGEDISIELKDFISVEKHESHTREDTPSVSPSRGWRLWPIPFRRVKSFRSPTMTSSNAASDSESSPHKLQKELSLPCYGGDVQSPRKQYMRTNVPTTEQIASLNLKDGQNMVAFSFSTRLWGRQQVDAHIYLWKWNARIVISDVDGTITKSDVLGQFMPLVGRDWSQSGVAGLFSAIKENGYQLLFLSARAIVQAYLTRSFLLNLKQDGKTLPTGPIVISPDGLFPSLYREVIRRAPHEFKIACLEDIRALFPSDYNPFYAGFGNRDTDELSYRKMGIPKGKIFIINPKGEVAINHRVDVKSYTSLHTLVNDMFPPTSLAEQEDFNSWNYWRIPTPSIDF